MTMTETWCQCCTFGNHTEPCTCDGANCCHGWRHKHGGLRDQVAAAVEHGLAFEKADPDSVPVEITNAVFAVVEPLVESIERQRMEGVVDAQEHTAKAEAQVARVRAFLEDMAGWCSPHGVAADYARRGLDALDGIDSLTTARACSCGRNPDPGVCPVQHSVQLPAGGHCACACNKETT